MSTPAEVEVRIGGKVHRGWTSYELASDLFTPADGWRVTLAKERIALPAEVVEGAAVDVALLRDGTSVPVLTGRVDEKQLAVGKGGQALTLVGRDGAGVLVDCSPALVSMQELTLDQVVARIVRPLGVTRIRISAAKPLVRERVAVEPGATAWDALRRAAEANGLWPWFEPDGTLVVGGPDYNQPPVDTLVMNFDGDGNNIEELTERRAMNERFSEVTVLGQAHAGGFGGGERDGKHNIKAVERDTGVKQFRPRTLIDHEAINADIARARGRKFISDSRLHGYTLEATVKGHYTAGGKAWTPGQRVTVKSEPHGIDAVFFLIGRRFIGSKRNGQVSVLTLKEDRVWVTEAHPSRRKLRRGKNSLPGAVWDIARGAS